MANSPAALSPADVYQVTADVLHPRHFFTAAPTSLEWAGPSVEDISWEVFQGRLLDPAHTRLRRSFLAWNIFLEEPGRRSAEPLLSVKLDAEAGQVHVIRALYCYAWEGYHAGDNVYDSRETTKWVRELVGTVSLARYANAAALRTELAGLVCRAVVGVSRLPLTSVEAPLPAFSLGQLAYFYGRLGEGGPARSPLALWERAWTSERTRAEAARVLEVLLRAAAPGELAAVARAFAVQRSPLGCPERDIPALFRTIFNEVALSPYTGFVDNALSFLRLLVAQGTLSAAAEVDFLSYLLRQLGRHLTAYDLVIFHHRGANYPDALLLDAVLKRYLELAGRHPDLFAAANPEAARRRRALRQGWLARRRYEEYPVPDAPTSPGENARVLPPPHVRVPEEQILQFGKRRQRLFTGDHLDRYLSEDTRALLRQSVQDLHHQAELRELGMAVFIDRPLGVFKPPIAPDQTLLLSQEAFSRSVAVARLAEIARLPEFALQPAERAALGEGLAQEVTGLPLSAVQCEERRIVSLADVRRVADDFLLLRSTRQGLADFLAQYETHSLARRCHLEFLLQHRQALIVPAPVRPGAQERVLAIYDGRMRKRLELGFSPEQGYEVRQGVEYLAGGLRVLQVWQGEDEEAAPGAHALCGEGLLLQPRLS